MEQFYHAKNLSVMEVDLGENVQCTKCGSRYCTCSFRFFEIIETFTPPPVEPDAGRDAPLA